MTKWVWSASLDSDAIEAILASLERVGLRIDLTESGPVLRGRIAATSPELLALLRRRRADLVAYLQLRQPLAREAGPPLPDPACIVEWAGWAAGDQLEGGVCAGDALPADWVRWRYLGEKRWYSWEGYYWDQRETL